MKSKNILKGNSKQNKERRAKPQEKSTIMKLPEAKYRIRHDRYESFVETLDGEPLAHYIAASRQWKNEKNGKVSKEILSGKVSKEILDYIESYYD